MTYQYTYTNNYIKRLERPPTKFEKDFCDWLNEVEQIVFKKISIPLLDLEDELYMINFEHHTTTQKMAKIVLEHYQEYCDNFFN
jgi:hypothetical protein